MASPSQNSHALKTSTKDTTFSICQYLQTGVSNWGAGRLVIGFQTEGSCSQLRLEKLSHDL
jgi:hypothetical protein